MHQLLNKNVRSGALNLHFSFNDIITERRWSVRASLGVDDIVLMGGRGIEKYRPSLMLFDALKQSMVSFNGVIGIRIPSGCYLPNCFWAVGG